MIVYTVQHIEAYYQLRKQGFLTGTPDRVWEDFREPYEWMMEQMQKHIPGYEGESYPIWLWKRCVNRNEEALLPKGARGVILTLDIPDELILWSHFSLWEDALCNNPVTINEEEWDAFMKDVKNYPVKESWDRIFECGHFENEDPEWIGKRENWVQGVTPKITMEMVKKVNRFISKGVKI